VRLLEAVLSRTKSRGRVNAIPFGSFIFAAVRRRLLKDFVIASLRVCPPGSPGLARLEKYL